jgi:hypothetical protein
MTSVARWASASPAWPGADKTTGEIECIEGGTEPAIAMLWRLATALDVPCT